MKSGYFYVNVGQVLFIAGAIVVGVHYLNICADASDIQRKNFNQRIVDGFKTVFSK